MTATCVEPSEQVVREWVVVAVFVTCALGAVVAVRLLSIAFGTLRRRKGWAKYVLPAQAHFQRPLTHVLRAVFLMLAAARVPAPCFLQGLINFLSMCVLLYFCVVAFWLVVVALDYSLLAYALYFESRVTVRNAARINAGREALGILRVVALIIAVIGFLLLLFVAAPWTSDTTVNTSLRVLYSTNALTLTVAFAFVLQIRDVVGAVSLLVDANLALGDIVRVGVGEETREGRVVSLGLRRVKLLDGNGTTHSVNGSQFLYQPVKVYKHKRRLVGLVRLEFGERRFEEDKEMYSGRVRTTEEARELMADVEALLQRYAADLATDDPDGARASRGRKYATSNPTTNHPFTSGLSYGARTRKDVFVGFCVRGQIVQTRSLASDALFLDVGLESPGEELASYYERKGALEEELRALLKYRCERSFSGRPVFEAVDDGAA